MKVQNIFNRFLVFMLIGGISMACEDPIDVNLDDPIPQLTVDGFVTDQIQTQTIRLTITQGYFENSFNPAATGATVTLTNQTTSEAFQFTDTNNDGDYTYENLANMPLIRLGDTYKLTVTYDSETYEAFSTANRTVPIDSISYEFREEGLGEEEGYYAQFHARDSSGTQPDFYRIRTWKFDASENTSFWLNKPEEISISAEGTFDENARQDNLPLFEFILPIRESINPVVDEDVEEAPYDLGDSIFVELHSIDEATFTFFAELSEQTNNGGLFATPLANIPTNIENTNPNAPLAKQAVGWFGVSLVSTEGTRVIE